MKWRGPFGGGAASGKSGALVASRAKSVQYLRARVTPINPNTTFQRAVRDAVKALTGLWQTMSDTARQAWNVYGQNVTKVNRLGDTVKVSGFNWFIGNNTPRLQAGFPAITAGPTIFDTGNPDWSTVVPIMTIGPGTTSGTLTTSSTITGLNGTNGHLLAYVSRPQSPGKTFFGGPFQLAVTVVSNSSGNIPAGSHTFSSPFVASGIGNADSNNFMDYIVRLDTGDGRLSSKFQATVVP